MFKTKKHGLPVHCGDGVRREFFRGENQLFGVSNTTFDRFAIIMGWLVEHHCMEWCDKYGEPGYNQPESGILFANWNNIPKAFQTFLESRGYELEWSDEWIIDYDYSKAWRTEPAGYWWEPSYMLSEDGCMFTPDTPQYEVIDYVSMRPRKRVFNGGFVPKWITAHDLIEEGYTNYCHRDYEGGREDKSEEPEEIVKEIWANPDHKIESMVLRRTNQSQVYDLYEVWVLFEDVEDA